MTNLYLKVLRKENSKVKLRQTIMGALAAVLLIAPATMAQKNPCNPCGGKKAMNACNPCNPCSMKGTHFYINDPAGRNSVTFTSTAPLEDIVGTSRQISGMIVFDPANPTKGGSGELTIAVASLNTGIPMRDEHLQGEHWLDAKKYPNIVFKINSVSNVKKVKSTDDFQTYDVTLKVELSFHGRTKKLEVPGRLTFMKESKQTKELMPGDLIAARASFDINLADFGVTGPKGMGLVGSKVGESINLSVSFRASNASPSMGNPCNPCNPCGGKKAMNACNPCNPCNPCDGKMKKKNPCNPCGRN